MIKLDPPRKFYNLDKKWYLCYLCGHYYPETRIITAIEDGHKYCNTCYRFRWRRKNYDDVRIEVTDDLD